MASLHFRGEKADKHEAEKKLMMHTAGVFDGRFTVRFESDDGGTHIVLVIEVEEPSKPLDRFLSDALWDSKWMGWRYIIKKVPPGYIDAILNAPERDDY
tara:strand:+ start:82 stop:378 length:297 start_codon:yes stop_codon:yes gene_type:complete